MLVCENSERCNFFNNKMSNMPSVARQLKKTYCEDRKTECARYMVKSMVIKGYTFKSDDHLASLESVLTSLYPNDHSTAREIIRQMER